MLKETVLDQEADALVVYGFDENLYQRALQWVRKGKRAIFITSQEKISSDPRVEIFLLESILQEKMLLKRSAWQCVFQKVQFVGETHLKKSFFQHHLAANLILSEASDFWTKPLKNARANLAPLKKGSLLKGAFSSIPAVIVGAGPSLKMGGEFLKNIQDQALIFAAGSALSQIEVEPHFAAHLDPIAPCRAHPFTHVPHLIQPRMSPENFSLISGEKILFADSSCHAINWIYEEEPFDGGWTVGNFAAAVADFLGCSPIIFVGMDFCYEGGEKYASLPSDHLEELVDFRGKKTQNDWIMAAYWMEERGKTREWIDTSKEGILDLKYQSFEEVAKNLKSQLRLKKRVQEALKDLESRDFSNRFSLWDHSLSAFQKGKSDTPFFQTLLEPLWNIWKPVFEREVQKDPTQSIEEHQKLFFQMVIEEHCGKRG